MKYSNVQKAILEKLLKKYEASKTYKGENQVAQSFFVKPKEVFAEYEKDSTDINLIEDFEKQCELLQNAGLVLLEKKHERIVKIYSGDDKWAIYRQILNIKDKHTRLKEEIDFYSKFLGENEIVKKFCNEQIERLKSGKEAKYEIAESEKIINLLLFILNNEDEILERELSISVLGDSKLFEKKYKARICKILRQAWDARDVELHDALSQLDTLDDKEINKIILESYNIFDNPTFVYFKGSASIYFADGNIINVTNENPLALSSVSIKNIQKVKINCVKIISVENLTSFNRVNESDTFFIYLSGYHNFFKQEFLKLIYEQNKEKKYFHFGDIDPDGFLILENLKAKTKIPFEKYKMSVNVLKKYANYTKVLEQNDVTKAKSLIAKGLYAEEMNFMLKGNYKLEQEIVSWMER